MSDASLLKILEDSKSGSVDLLISRHGGSQSPDFKGNRIYQKTKVTKGQKEMGESFLCNSTSPGVRLLTSWQRTSCLLSFALHIRQSHRHNLHPDLLRGRHSTRHPPLDTLLG